MWCRLLKVVGGRLSLLEVVGGLLMWLLWNSVLTYLRGLCCKLISELLLEKSNWSQLAAEGAEHSLRRPSADFSFSSFLWRPRCWQTFIPHHHCFVPSFYRVFTNSVDAFKYAESLLLNRKMCFSHVCISVLGISTVEGSTKYSHTVLCCNKYCSTVWGDRVPWIVTAKTAKLHPHH